MCAQESLTTLVDEFDKSRPIRGRSAGGAGGATMRHWGKPIGVAALVVVTVGALTFLAMRTVGGPQGARLARQRTVIDSETGKVFKKFMMREGETFPLEHPQTGKRTLYPVEKCYYTRDGQAKLEPTYVLLNEMVGKDGPTICHDCGRRVVWHNPAPTELLNEALARRRAESGG